MSAAVIPERFTQVLAELAPLVQRFVDAGHRLYLVGGAVRDLLLGETHERARLRPDHGRPPVPDQGVPAWLGQRDLGARRALRHDRSEAQHWPRGTNVRDHDVPLRRLRRRLAQAAGLVLGHDRRGPRPARLHDQRDRPRADGHPVGSSGARRSPWRGARPGQSGSAHPACAAAQLRRRPAADVAGGPLHRPLRADTGSRGGGRRPGQRRSIGDRLGGTDPRRARQADRARPARRRAVVLRGHRPRRALLARASRPAPRTRPDSPPQGRAEPHDRRGRRRFAPPPSTMRHGPTTSGSHGWPPCSTTSANHARAATSPARAPRSTITTPSARGSPASGWRRCAIPPRTLPQ